MENYISKIKQILKATGWTQNEFALEMRVTFATVNRWLNGHTRPQPAQLARIDELFKSIIGILPIPKAEIENALKSVMKKKKRFHNIRALLQKEEIMENFLLELTYNSDAIEGSTLTKKDTEAIIFDKATIKDKSLIEHLEAANHAAILKEIFKGKIKLPITEDLIKHLHKSLMHGIREDGGEYAEHQRGIRGVDLILPHPKDIPEEMRLLARVINDRQGHPVKHIAKMHAAFEAIHPFGDGNGRVGRLIMIIQLIHKGLAPCLITINKRSQYYECLEYAQKHSETHLVCFLAEAILRGYGIIEKYRL